jgi:hypothetical protein
MFGPSFDSNALYKIGGPAVIAQPAHGCVPIQNAQDVQHKVLVVTRGNCMFVEKVCLDWLNCSN